MDRRTFVKSLHVDITYICQTIYCGHAETGDSLYSLIHPVSEGFHNCRVKQVHSNAQDFHKFVDTESEHSGSLYGGPRYVTFPLPSMRTAFKHNCGKVSWLWRGIPEYPKASVSFTCSLYYPWTSILGWHVVRVDGPITGVESPISGSLRQESRSHAAIALPARYKGWITGEMTA